MSAENCIVWATRGTEAKVVGSQGNAKFHAVRVEILKFPTFACPMNHKGFADMKVQLPVAYSARWRSMKIFFS